MNRRLRTFVVVFAFLPVVVPAQDRDTVRTIRLIAVGDVNLGRSLGQRLLHGETDYPFSRLAPWFRTGDIVFANLEGPVSDQNGETESRGSNVVFCAPPVAARTLRNAGVTVVSTANNHAADYGAKGIRETIAFLSRDSVAAVGTSAEEAAQFPPVVVTKNGIRVGFVAYTDLVNGRRRWNRSVAMFDSLRAAREIDSLRRQADIVVASYHGGVEYGSRIDSATRRNQRWLIDSGADIVLGHHPHVAWGVEMYRGKLVFQSLGNCVFYQPQRTWSMLGIGVEVEWRVGGGKAALARATVVPLRASFQPTRDLAEKSESDLMKRIVRMSNLPMKKDSTGYAIGFDH